MKSKSLYPNRCFGVLMGILLLFSFPAHAVSEAAVLFLQISPSAQANGMGQTYGNCFDTDPAAATFNPAALGLFAKDHYLGSGLNYSRWLPASALSYFNYSLVFGYDFGKTRGLPFAVGLGYQFIYLDLGKQYHTLEDSPEPIGTFESSEKAHIITAAALFDYFVRGGIGVNFKKIHSLLGPYGYGAERIEANASAEAIDIGFFTQIPFWDLLEKISPRRFFLLPQVKPVFTPTFFSSLRNVGEEIVYIDAAQADPLPRCVHLGVSLAIEIVYHHRQGKSTMLSVRCSREAEDLLIKRYPDGSFDYLHSPNEIRYGADILRGKANDRVITKKGWQFALGDMIFFRTGRYEDQEGKVMLKTKGIGVDAMGPIKTFIALDLIPLEDNWLKKWLLHMNIDFNYSHYKSDTEDHPLEDTEFRSVSFRLQNISL